MRVTKILEEAHLRPSKTDDVRKESDSLLLLFIHVIIAWNDDRFSQDLIGALERNIPFKEDELHYCLGMKVDYDMAKRTLTLSQGRYVRAIVDKFRLADASVKRTPLPSGGVFDDVEPLPKEDNIEGQSDRRARLAYMASVPYRSIIGALQYAASTSRPDVAYAVNVLSKASNNFTAKHWEAAKRVVRYLAGVPDLGLHYRGQPGKDPGDELELIGYIHPANRRGHVDVPRGNRLH